MEFKANGGETGLDFELNLAPIIDCLTVLITFTLISASFLSISVLDAGMAGQADASQAPPPVALELKLSGPKMTLVARGAASENILIPAKNGDLDLDTLKVRLAEFKKRWPTVQGLSVLSDDETDYKSIVRAMDATKVQYQAVALGGI